MTSSADFFGSCLDNNLLVFSSEFLTRRAWIGVPRRSAGLFVNSADFARLETLVPSAGFDVAFLEYDGRGVDEIVSCADAAELRRVLAAELDSRYWVLKDSGDTIAALFAPPDLHWDVAGRRGAVEHVCGAEISAAIDQHVRDYDGFPSNEIEFHAAVARHYAAAVL